MKFPIFQIIDFSIAFFLLFDFPPPPLSPSFFLFFAISRNQNQHDPLAGGKGIHRLKIFEGERERATKEFSRRHFVFMLFRSLKNGAAPRFLSATPFLLHTRFSPLFLRPASPIVRELASTITRFRGRDAANNEEK